MDFVATVKGESYQFSNLGRNMFLISGRGVEYIVYKTGRWQCADEISSDLLRELGTVIEEHLQIAH